MTINLALFGGVPQKGANLLAQLQAQFAQTDIATLR
tara:strand:+ start:9268 stop:9375 length:108 start_codon:yes stop_codon:yes gene_type:complete